MQLPGLFSARRWSFESAAMWALLLGVFLSIVVFIPVATIPFLYTKVSVLALGGIVAFICYVLARLTRGNIIAPPLPLLGALLLVPFAYALSALFAGAPAFVTVFGHAAGADTLGFMVLAGFLGVLAALTVRHAEHYRSFLRTGAVLVGLVLIAQIVILVLGLTSGAVNPSASIVGSFFDLATLAGLGIVMTLVAQRFMTFSRSATVALGLSVLAALFFLAIANSTVTWLLVGLTALGLFVEGVMRRVSAAAQDSYDFESLETEELSVTVESETVTGSRESSARIGTPLFVLAVALFFLIGGSTIVNPIDSALKVNLVNVRPSWQSTITVGKATYKTNAIFGSGPNTFGQQWLKSRDAALNTTQFWNTDFTSGIGFVPTSFVTTGIVGAIAWLGLLGLFLFFGLRALIMRDTDEPSVPGVAVTLFVGLLFLFTEMIFSVPSAPLIALAFVIAGVFASTLRYTDSRGQVGVSFSQSPRLGFVIVFVLTILLLATVGAAYVVVERYLAQVDLVQAGNAYAAGNLTAADAAAAQSLLLVASDDAYRAESLIKTARIKTLLASTSTPATQAKQQMQTLIAQSVANARAATDLNPDNYQNWFTLGAAYQAVVPLGISGAYGAATSSYAKAQALNPTNPVIPFTLAQLAIANKSYKDAEPLLQKAVSLKPDYTQAIFSLSQLEAQLGKSAEALKAAEAAAYFAPNDPTVLFQVGVLRESTGDYAGAITALTQAVQLNPQYANARYFLAQAYAHQKQYSQAVAQLQAIAKLSTTNAKAVAADIAALQKSVNPFATAGTKSVLGATTPPTLSGK